MFAAITDSTATPLTDDWQQDVSQVLKHWCTSIM